MVLSCTFETVGEERVISYCIALYHIVKRISVRVSVEILIYDS
jgi:hypothetical protein